MIGLLFTTVVVLTGLQRKNDPGGETPTGVMKWGKRNDNLAFQKAESKVKYDALNFGPFPRFGEYLKYQQLISLDWRFINASF
jgi:hypothetical protein